jgi:hypothetical protein
MYGVNTGETAAQYIIDNDPLVPVGPSTGHSVMFMLYNAITNTHSLVHDMVAGAKFTYTLDSGTPVADVTGKGSVELSTGISGTN